MVEAGRSALAEIEGKGLTALSSDHVRTLGLVKCLEIVGEAAGRLSPEFRARYAGIPWSRIIGMRNRLVHAYFEIDYEQVWKTLTEDLPPLLDELETILANEFKDGSD
ncbi:MAG: HepT-like ribonuclease domain-containing protein [Thermodesulfobacteriota bacterium]